MAVARLAPAGEPPPGGVDLKAVAQKADAAVPSRNQVADCLACRPLVVDDHRVGLNRLGGTVDEHHRHAGLEIARQVGLVAGHRREHEPVHPAGAEALHQLALALGILVRAAHEGEHPARASHLLHAPVQGGEEGVGHVLDHQAHARRGPIGAPEGARREVAPVASISIASRTRSARSTSHGSLAVDHPGDRAELIPASAATSCIVGRREGRCDRAGGRGARPRVEKTFYVPWARRFSLLTRRAQFERTFVSTLLDRSGARGRESSMGNAIR